MPLLVSMFTLVIMVFAIVDIILRDNGEVKHMPKIVWLLLVILLPLLGSILWFALGREYAQGQIVLRPRAASRAAAPPSSPAPPRETRTTEQQLADLEREIEEERLRAEIARRRAERGD